VTGHAPGVAGNETKVKVCGLSRPEDIAVANETMPDYIGFVFAPSPRRIDAGTAANLKRLLDPKILTVGVFVNAPAGVIASLRAGGIIDLAQLHGDEDDEFIRHLRQSCDCPVIKAIPVADKLPEPPEEPDYLLFDTLSRKRGGSGKAFDWALLDGYAGIPYFLSGGLTAETVADAIRTLSPYAVDVSTGVETNGVKDPEKIRDFVRNARH